MRGAIIANELLIPPPPFFTILANIRPNDFR